MGKVVVRGAEVRQQVIDILRAGGSLDDAAEATGFGRNYVRQIGAKHGIRFKRGTYGKHTTSKYDREKIIKLHLAGKRAQEIADVLRISSTTVYKALREAGMQRRPKEKQNIVYVMRFCLECNTAFLCDPRTNKKFCSPACGRANAHRRNDVTRRARKKSRVIDTDITLAEVAARDGGLCYLCGLPVEWEDYHMIGGKKYASRKYPSIDHVKPLSRGGAHSWENVRLAHFSCNASKGADMVG